MYNDHYVYAYFRYDGSPVYIGRGRGGRWKRQDLHSTHIKAIVKKEGRELPSVLLRTGLTLEESQRIEIAFIAAIGREIDGGPLVNLSIGGDGSQGAKMSPEWRVHRSKKAKELWENEEYRSRLLRADRQRSGNKTARSVEFKQAMSDRLQGNTHTLGHKHSEEAKSKMKLRWQNPEWVAKMMAKRKAIGMYTSEWAKKGSDVRYAKHF